MVQVRPKKILKPINKARELVKLGRIYITEHAYKRMHERDITDFNIYKVIKEGWHIPSRDTFNNIDGWSYCFEGFISDEKKIRLAVAFSNSLIIITVINIDKGY